MKLLPKVPHQVFFRRHSVYIVISFWFVSIFRMVCCDLW